MTPEELADKIILDVFQWSNPHPSWSDTIATVIRQAAHDARLEMAAYIIATSGGWPLITRAGEDSILEHAAYFVKQVENRQ